MKSKKYKVTYSTSPGASAYYECRTMADALHFIRYKMKEGNHLTVTISRLLP